MLAPSGVRLCLLCLTRPAASACLHADVQVISLAAILENMEEETAAEVARLSSALEVANADNQKEVSCLSLVGATYAALQTCDSLEPGNMQPCSLACW